MSYIDFYCASCGREIEVYSDANGIHTEPCEHCNEDLEGEAYERGLKDGKEEERIIAYEEGYNKGYDKGSEESYREGEIQGYRTGKINSKS